MRVEFRESFVKDLKSVKDKSLLQRVQAVIESIEKADSLAELTNLKKLKGSGSYFRVRIGDYRLGLALKSDAVIFVRLPGSQGYLQVFPITAG